MPLQIDIAGPEGNAFAIISLVRSVLKQCNKTDKIEDVINKLHSAKDYDELLVIAKRETFDLLEFVDSRNTPGKWVFIEDTD